MSGGGGGRSDIDVGSGGGSSPDECNSLDVETALNSPNPIVLKTLKKGDVLAVAVEEGANKRKSLVAKHGGQIAGSLTPPSLPTILSCIEKGFNYGARLLDAPSGAVVRVRIQPKA